jgi:peptidyl-prolyl cis-trans isomerase C
VNRIALWTVVSLLLISGAWMLGQKGGSHAPETAGTSPEAEVAPADVPRPKGDFILATVNGEPIYHTDFVLAVQSLPPAAQPIAAKAAGKKVILDELIKLKVLKQEARRRGLDKEPEIAVQLSSALDNMLAAVALERLVSDAPSDMQAFYEAYRNQFRGTRVRQVLVAYEGGLIPPKEGGRALPEAEARAKASRLADRIRSGESFGAVATAESDDTQSATQGGDLGLVRPGQLGTALESEIDKLEVNRVSEPIKSAYGFHVFEVTGREVSTFDQIEGALRSQGGQLRAQIVVNDLREKANVTIENEAFFEPTVP